MSFFQVWVDIEAGRLDDAAALATDMVQRAERYGIELWRLMGLVELAAIDALVWLADGNADRTASSADITSFTELLTVAWDLAGVGIYRGFLESIRARRLIAAGQRDEARRRLDAVLQKADDNDEHFYDAELLRLRAHAHLDADAGAAGFGAAAELARREGAALFELRAALDDFELRGQPACAAFAAAVGRMPPAAPCQKYRGRVLRSARCRPFRLSTRRCRIKIRIPARGPAVRVPRWLATPRQRTNMSTSARGTAPLLLAVTAAAWGIGMATAAPAAADPGDSAGAAGASTVPPVITIIDGIWNAHVGPNAIVPQSPVGGFVQQFLPPPSQVRDFFGFIQQFRPPGPTR